MITPEGVCDALSIPTPELRWGAKGVRRGGAGDRWAGTVWLTGGLVAPIATVIHLVTEEDRGHTAPVGAGILIPLALGQT